MMVLANKTNRHSMDIIESIFVLNVIYVGCKVVAQGGL